MATPEEVFGNKKRTPEEVFGGVRKGVVTSTISGKVKDYQQLAGDEIQSLLDFVSQREPGIDYSSGVPNFGFRAALSRADTEDEVRNILDSVVGKGNYRRDQFGSLVIEPEGLRRLGIDNAIQPRAIDERGLSLGDIADISGDAPAIAGAVVAGAATGGLGIIPATLATGAGAVAGKLAGETGEQIAGENLQSFPEVLSDAGKEGALAAAGEGVFRTILRPIGRKILAPEAKRVTPEIQQLTEEARSFGLKPSVSQITKAPLLGRAQALAERIFGDPNAVANSKALNEAIKVLQREAGPGVTSRVSLGETIQGNIKQARSALSNWAKQAYSQVDELMGSNPVIPTAGLKRVAKEYMDELPKTQSGKVALTSPETTAQLSDILDLPENITSSQMQAIRSRLFDAVQDNTIVPGVSSKIARDLGHAANESFSDAVKAGTVTGEAADVLKAVGRRYGKEIKKFQNAFIQRIVRDPKYAGSVDPEQIVSAAFQKGHSANLRRLMAVLPQETKEKVKRVAMEDILKNVIKRTDDPLVDVFDGKKLLNVLDSYGDDTLNAMFGRDLANRLRQFGRVTQFITQKQAQSGGLVAANLALRPMQNLGRLVKINVLSRFLNTDKGLQWLTTGLRVPKTRKGAAALSRLTTQINMLVDEATKESKDGQ